MTPNEKVSLFCSFFRGREDAYAVRWEGGSGAGYRPVFEQFSATVARRHLRGEIVAGVYPLLPDNTTWFLAIDFDGPGAANDAVAVMGECQKRELPALLERSRSGVGFHVWLFFAKAIPAERVRRLGQHLTQSAQVELRSLDRFFPSQDRHVGTKGLGNLIALPLQWQAREMGNTEFVEAHTQSVLPCPWSALTGTRRLEEDDLELVLSEPTRHLYSPLPLTRTEQLPCKVVEETQAPLKVILTEHVEVSLPCPGPIMDTLTKLSRFHNPVWFSKRKQGRYLGDTPRFIEVGGSLGDTWVLPRGLWSDLRAALVEAGTEYEVSDQRTHSSALEWSQDFQLRSHQVELVHLLLPHEAAVLEAPTGSGKTLIAMEMMARREVPTLVLVHRRQLLDQWVERIGENLGIEKRKVGLIRRGKITLGEAVTITTIQSLVERDLEEVSAWCGQVVVDECHHVPAKTFASVLRRLKPTYLLGLTATAKRKDGLARLIFAYLGPLVKAATPRELNKKSVIVLPELVVHRTEFQHAGDLHIQELRNVVQRDSGRNEQIAADVVTAVEEGHLVLLLSDRKEHCDLLCDALKGRVGCATMYGRVGKKARKEIFTEFESRRIQVLIATAALVGEGWDCPSLSALFLGLPMGRSSRLEQLAGRLTRPDPDKPPPVLHDYFDENVQVLRAMFHRRLKAFRRLLGDERLPQEFRIQRRERRAELTYAQSPPLKSRKTSVRESEGQLYLFE
jgi:superfamily II DNA or RNA helicase